MLMYLHLFVSVNHFQEGASEDINDKGNPGFIVSLDDINGCGYV